MGAPTPIDAEVNLECDYASSTSVERRSLTAVGSQPDDVVGATYYDLRSYVKALLRLVTENVGIPSSTGGGAGPSRASRP